MDNARAMEELIKVLKESPNKAFDFVAANFWRFTKEDLKQVLLELMYAVYHLSSESVHDKIMESCANSLDDIYTEYWKRWG